MQQTAVVEGQAAAKTGAGVRGGAPHPDDKFVPRQQGVSVIANFAGVIVPFAALITAIVLLWGVAFDWFYLALMMGMFAVSALGITVGYHRYFTHRSFETVKPVAFLLAVAGSMAAQGSVLEWVATHRKHHQHSDGEEDPHSPNLAGGGVAGVLKGMWHAHVGWILAPRPAGFGRYIGDLRKSRMIRVVSALFPVWMLLGLLIPAAAAGLYTQTWTGALLGFLWGGLVRIFLVHHITWSVNSVCHLWGYRSFESHDESRNNVLIGVLALGEGFHNNHHAFPTSARHGLRWWEVDISYLFIRLLMLVGLAKAVKVPTQDRMEMKRKR